MRAIQGRLLLLMIRFLHSEIGPAHFVRRFSRLWAEHRDAQWKARDNWNEPLDKQLKAALLRKEISPEEFSKRWDELWGVRSESDREFLDMIDRVHSACDVFRPKPGSEFELNEDQLRSSVAESLAAYLRVIAGRRGVGTR